MSKETATRILARREIISGLAASAAVPALAGTTDISTVPVATNEATRSGIYNLRDFGAKGDGVTLDTRALQAAIDTCFRNGGGTVLVPPGTFLIGTTELKSHTRLYIAAGATLLGSTVPDHYHAAESVPLNGDVTLPDGHFGLLFGANAENITIEGSGIISGQGEHFFDPTGGRTDRPCHVLLYRCRQVRVRDVVFRACAFHSLRMIQSRYIYIDGIRIDSLVNTNNDGFHFISCEHVAISNCIVACGDDACALFGSCQFVTVSNCTFSTRWSVFRFGGFPYGGGFVRNVTVSNCLIYDTYGCPIKIEGSGMRVENLHFSNIILENVTGPIGVNFGETPSGQTATHSSPFESRPYVRNLTFQNIRATVAEAPDARYEKITTYMPVALPGEQYSCIVFNGSGNHVIEDVTLDNVHVTFAGGGSAELAAKRKVGSTVGEYMAPWSDSPPGPPAYGVYARGVRGLTLNNVRLKVAKRDARPAMILDTVQDVAITGLSVEGDIACEALRFCTVTDALLSSTRILTPARSFIQLEGTGNQRIKVESGDWANAQYPLTVRDGAKDDVVQFRT